MKPFSLKTFVSAALIFTLCGCVQSGGRQNLSLKAAGDVTPNQDVDSTGTGGLPQSLSTGPGHPSEVVARLEKGLALDDGSRGTKLAELARLFFALGETAKAHERLAWYEKGRHYAELLRREEPNRVEGYYWLALNLCGICELSRAGHALSMVSTIARNLELALAIDESYDQGGPLRVLGRIRYAAPSWPLSEGDLKESLHLLRVAARIAPDNSTNHLYLAEALFQLGEAKEACTELDRVCGSKSHASSFRGLEDDQARARVLMTVCGPALAKSAPERGTGPARDLQGTARNDLAK